MTQSKLVALWIAAMVALAGVYWYSTREPGKNTRDAADCKCAQCIDARKKGIATDAPAGLALGAAMLPVSGAWFSADGKEPEFKGHVVLLDFWGTLCVPCVASIPSNNGLYEKYASHGFVLAGISMDPKGLLSEFRKPENRDIRYPLLASDEKTFAAYKIDFTPSLFLFDRNAKLIWSGSRIAKNDGTLDEGFEKTFTAAMNATVAAGDVSPAVELPPEFQKLIDKSKAAREKEPLEPEESEADRGLKIGAEIPELKGDWLTPNNAAPDLKNKVLMIDFFTTVCGSCVEAIPHNNALSAKYGPQGLVFMATSPEPKDVVGNFKLNFKTPVQYPVLSNAEALFKTCEVTALPVVLMFGRNGKLAWKGSSVEKDGKLDADFEKALNAALK